MADQDSRVSPLLRINSTGKNTEQLLGEILAGFNDGYRVTFLCDSGVGPAVIQRLRMRLSRLRASMDAKGIAKQHFRLLAQHYPYTNLKGNRYDCVVMIKIKTQQHKVYESVEGMMKDAIPRGNASSQEAITGGYEW